MKWLKVNYIKTADASDLVKKAGYDTRFGEAEKKILDNHGKYITSQKYIK